MNPVESSVEQKINDLVEVVAMLEDAEKISAMNRIKSELHRISPFRAEPIDCVLWVPRTTVQPNDYNPNSVPPPEFRLLSHSVKCDGYTQPIVTWHNDDKYQIVDGEHRYKVGSTVKMVTKRILGHLPVTVINSDRTGPADRRAATIRHNRARGVHAVSSMTDIVADMLADGLSDDGVAYELGMDADEFLRFKQNSGMPELFKNHEYSKSWVVGE